MTDEQALEFFKEELKDGKCSDECIQCNAYETAIKALERQMPVDTAKAPDVALYKPYDPMIEASEKQKPKRPLPDKKYFGIGKCPNCSAVFTDKSTNYCGNCGQRIDWSENDEKR